MGQLVPDPALDIDLVPSYIGTVYRETFLDLRTLADLGNIFDRMTECRSLVSDERLYGLPAPIKLLEESEHGHRI